MSERGSAVKGFIRDTATAGAIVAVLLLILLAYSGIWPPMVVVESGSMQHDTPGQEPVSHIGVIDTGDLVLVKRADKASIHTYIDGVKENYRTYGEYGDVIIYFPNGDRSQTPIIHRTIVYLELNATTGRSYDIPSLIDYPGNWSIVPYELTHEYVHRWYDLSGTLYLYNVGYYNVTVEINLEMILRNNPHPNSGYITMGDNAATNAPVYDQAGSISWAYPVPPSDVKGVARGEIPWFGLMKLYVSNGHIPPRTPANSVTELIISLILLTVLPFLYDFVVGPYVDKKYGKEEEDGSSSENKYRAVEVPPPPPEPIVEQENREPASFRSSPESENRESETEEENAGYIP